MYYGWLIVAGAFIAQFFVTGFYTYGFPVLAKVVKKEFNVSAADVMEATLYTVLLGLIVAPIVGYLADKWSARKLVCIGSICLGAGLIFLSEAKNIFEFVVIFAIFLCLANNLLGPATSSTLVSRWFSTSRGKALGVAAIGTSIGGILIPLYIAWGIGPSDDWRKMLFDLGVFILVFLPIFLYFVLRDYPSDLGLVGEPQAAESLEINENQINDPDLTIKDILCSKPFWLLGVTLGLLFSSQSAVLANIGIHFDNINMGDQAKNFIMTLAVMGFLGKLAFGYAADRINLKVGLSIAIVLAMCGVLILASQSPSIPIKSAAIFLGLATGGMLPVWGAMIAAIFGVKSYGRVMGAMSPLIALLVMPGPILCGWLFDIYGNYSNSFYLFTSVLGASLLILFLLKVERIS
ncbi:MAG: MFS transporter [Cellvibrionales bacterium]|nr:MFS transporter [Cellvibrionales bacterium]|tara:strand:- start:15699 stop:16916 length:1218 start_codon:yes stop_codon:yes gene_type:complete